MRLLIASLVLAAAVLAGCDDDPAPAEPVSGVSPAAVERIEAEVDCRVLQEEFDVAADNGHLGYMDLIDRRLTERGCY